MAPFVDHYQALDIDQTASPGEIRSVYKKLALKWHPDKCTDVSRIPNFTAKFRTIQEAYELLSDNDKRRRYNLNYDHKRGTQWQEQQNDAHTSGSYRPNTCRPTPKEQGYRPSSAQETRSAAEAQARREAEKQARKLAREEAERKAEQEKKAAEKAKREMEALTPVAKERARQQLAYNEWQKELKQAGRRKDPGLAGRLKRQAAELEAQLKASTEEGRRADTKARAHESFARAAGEKARMEATMKAYQELKKDGNCKARSHAFYVDDLGSLYDANGECIAWDGKV